MSADPDFTPSVGTFSLTAGGTSQLMLAADPRRYSILLNPQTRVSLFNFGATAGVQATGTLTFGTNPTNTETIAVNGVTFTFVTGSSTSTNVHIGATKELTAAEFIVVLNASANASVALATYTLASNIVTVTADAGGTDGNAFTLADSSGGNVTRSAATLTGGSDTIGNGISVAALGNIILNAQDYPQIKNDIYVVSASDADKTCYLVGYGS